MELIVSFFRDTLSGWVYFLNLVLNLFIIMVCVGIMGDKKKAEIQKAIRERREYELVTGISAKKAAMEGKQVISVLEDETNVVADTEKVVDKIEINDVLKEEIKKE